MIKLYEFKNIEKRLNYQSNLDIYNKLHKINSGNKLDPTSWEHVLFTCNAIDCVIYLDDVIEGYEAYPVCFIDTYWFSKDDILVLAAIINNMVMIKVGYYFSYGYIDMYVMINPCKNPSKPISHYEAIVKCIEDGVLWGYCCHNQVRIDIEGITEKRDHATLEEILSCE